MHLLAPLFDRRRMLVTAAAVLAVGCSREGEGKPVARKDSGQAQSSGMWGAFRQIYLDASGRIVDNGNGGVSHTEGQGYGMVLAVQNNDRPAFEALLNWTETHLARQDVALFSWRYDPRLPNPIADPNNATDGDLMIALGLARAARQWGVSAWETRSAQIRAAIRQRLVVERFGQHLLLPGIAGFDNGASVTLNPSYFVWPALDAFSQYDGEGVWGPVIESAEAMVRGSRFGPSGLPTDWIVVGPDGKPAPAPDKPPRFGFDAVRVPLYAMAGHRASLVAPIADFWRGKQAAGQVPAWVDVTSGEQAPYALSPGGLDVMRRLLGQPLGHEALAQDYYACMLQMLARDLV